MTTSLTRAAGLCALLATTCLVSPALAQSTGKPSIYKNVDDNGVDLTDGSFNFNLVEGAIGSGEGAIALMRSFGSGGENDNLSVRFNRSVTSGTANIALIFGNGREEFSGPDAATSFTSAQGSGATLTKLSADSYRYVDADGTATVYGPPPGLTNASNNGYCSPTSEANCGLIATQTTAPDGAITSYEWDVGENCTITGYDRFGEPIETCAQFWRQRGLSNNSGYSVRFTFEQEANPTSGLPNSAWHKRVGATLQNNAVASTPRTVSYAFPSSSVTEITTDGGRTWRLTKDSAARIVGIRRPGITNDNVTIGYAGTDSLVVSQITVDGVTTNYGRSVSGSVGTMTATDALGHSRTIVSDLTIGRPTKLTDELSRVTEFSYDPQGRLTRTLYPEGNSLQRGFDARGNVTSTSALAKGYALPEIVNTAGYDATCTNAATCNQPLWTKDAAGNQTDFVYDPATGNLTTVTAPAAANGVRPQTRYGYSSVTGVSMLTSTSTCQTAASCAGTADEVKASIVYGANRLPVSVSTGAGDGSLTATSSVTYTPAGDVETIDGPLSGAADTSRTRYNASREAIGVVGPDPDGAGPLKQRAVRSTINGEGQLITQESGTVTDQSDAAWNAFQSLEQVSASFDANGRLVKRTMTAGGISHAAIEYSYDTEGRSDCVAQRMDPTSFGAMTNACTLTATGSFGPDRITRTIYDAADQVTQTRVAVGTPDEAAEVSSAYTANSQVQSVMDAENNKTTYVYDAHDRVSRTLYPVPTKGAAASSSTDYEEFGFDSRSNVVSRRVRSGQVIGYSYDALSRLTSKDLPNEADVTYGYDNLGRLKTASDTNGYNGGFSYDALGRQLTEFSTWYGTRSSQYDLAGRRTRLTWNDGFFLTYDHLVTGEMSAIRENGAGSGVGVLASFAYDDLGRRTSLTRGNGTVTSYGFDPVSRLAQLTQDIGGTASDLSLGFSYNPASQITSNSRSNDAFAWTGHGSGTIGSTANGLNQLTQVGATALSYDGKGNLTSDGTKSYGYTAENRLASAPGTQVGYDPLGRLYYLASTQTVFDHDGANVITELDSPTGQQVRRRYVHGPGADEALVWYEGGGTGDRRFLHADERGSVVAVSDSAGNTIAVNKYDEYGVPASTNIGSFQYTGQKWVSEIGLYDYKARVYDPKLGRFLQTDPIGYGDGMNLYGYVGGDPVNLNDPSGLSFSVGGSLGGFTKTTYFGPSGGRPVYHYEERYYVKNGKEYHVDYTLKGISYRGGFDGLGGNLRASLTGGGGGSQPRHAYPIALRVTPRNTRCSISQVAKMLNHYAIPGADGPKTDGQNYTVRASLIGFGGYDLRLRLGTVSFASRNGGMTVQNTTRSDHMMRDGTVVMSIVGSQSNGYSISGVGFGTNVSWSAATMNQGLGPSAFQAQASKMAEALKQCN